MHVFETKDEEKIYRVLKDPEIYDRITDDGAVSVDEFTAPILNDVYYLTDENNIGLVFYHWVNSVTLQGHIQILKEYRGQAMEFGKGALKWAWDNTEAQKITIFIPELYRDVIGFVKKFGFQQEGVSKGSYMKNSVLYDRILLGLSR